MTQSLSPAPQGAIVPPGKQTFFGNGGVVLAGGSVTMYVAGTTILASTWQDAALTIPNTNPIVLDENGQATIWGLGAFTQVVADVNGNQQYSQETVGNVTSLALADTGTANAYVTAVPGLVTSGITDPIAQLTGVQLYLVAANTNTGAATLAVSGLSAVPIVSTSNVALVGGEIQAGAYTALLFNPTFNKFQLVASTVSPGLPIPGEIRAFAGAAGNIPNGWAACYGQAVSRTTYPNTFANIGTVWGAGDGVTTYNLPDLRGRSLFGADAMGGTAANRLTTASLGTASAGGIVGVTGGNELLQSHTHTLTDPGHSHSTVGQVANNGGASAFALSQTGSNFEAFGNAVPTGTTITGITIASTGTGQSQNLPPAGVVEWIISLS